jgi:hypothetical protein
VVEVQWDFQGDDLMNGRKDNPNRNNLPESVGKFIGGSMGLIFGGVGITLLIFLWGSPFNEFGSPPLFFRVFGSFIGLAFVLFGGGAFIATVAGGKIINRLPSTFDTPEEASKESQPQPFGGSLNYTCPKCSAPLSDGIEVSPHGDVKCSFCNGWYNIHGK